jgi:hypothetical protein
MWPNEEHDVHNAFGHEGTKFTRHVATKFTMRVSHEAHDGHEA